MILRSYDSTAAIIFDGQRFKLGWFLQALYQIVVLLTLNYGGKKILKLENESNPTLVKNTIVFNAFVFCQVGKKVLLLESDYTAFN
jgi:hypothetical protein